MGIKSSGMAPGLVNARPPGTTKTGKCPAVARGGGWAQLELTDALCADVLKNQ